MRHTAFVSRREFVAAAALGAVSTVAGCDALGITDPSKADGSARLSARPGAVSTPGTSGLRPLGLGNSLADGMVYVPASYQPSTPAPFALLLHGAGGVSSSFITPFLPIANTTGQVLLAVDSRKITWDGIGNGRFGPDIAFLDLALRDTFAKYAVDARRVAVGGFSDGATMSLAVGLTNGDLFTKVIAWSPGGLIGSEYRGKPPVFVTHGASDPIISVRVTREDTVPALERRGYAVAYREHLGGHTVPDELRYESMLWAAA